MGLFSSLQLNSLQDLFVEQLQDLYDAEQRIVEALPQMAGAAHNASLKSAFEQHLRETQNHVKRLEQVFQTMGQSGIVSAYGAAGSLVVILLWVYYSSQILLLGAEFTYVYADHRGKPLVPAENAEAATEEARAREGKSPASPAGVGAGPARAPGR